MFSSKKDKKHKAKKTGEKGSSVTFEDNTAKLKWKDVVKELRKIAAKKKKVDGKYKISNRERELLRAYAGRKSMNKIMRGLVVKTIDTKVAKKGGVNKNAKFGEIEDFDPQMLKAYLRDPEIRGYLRDEEGRTMFHCAASLGFIPFFRFITKVYPAGVREVSFNGETILHSACKSGKIDMINRILEKYPEISPKRVDGRGRKPFELLSAVKLHERPGFKKYLDITTDSASFSRSDEADAAGSGAVSGVSSATSAKSVSGIMTSCTSHSG